MFNVRLRVKSSAHPFDHVGVTYVMGKHTQDNHLGVINPPSTFSLACQLHLNSRDRKLEALVCQFGLFKWPVIA